MEVAGMVGNELCTGRNLASVTLLWAGKQVAKLPISVKIAKKDSY